MTRLFQCFLVESDPTPLTAVPEAPSTPEITAVTRECITVAWKEPKSDGGSHVFGYHLQMKDRNSILWQRVNKTLIRAAHFKVTTVSAGLVYEFKVAAENAAGLSGFSKASDAVLAIDACGELDAKMGLFSLNLPPPHLTRALFAPYCCCRATVESARH